MSVALHYHLSFCLFLNLLLFPPVVGYVIWRARAGRPLSWPVVIPLAFTNTVASYILGEYNGMRKMKTCVDSMLQLPTPFGGIVREMYAQLVKPVLTCLSSVWKAPLSSEEAIAVVEAARQTSAASTDGTITAATATTTERALAAPSDSGPIVKPVSHSWREHRRKKQHELQQHEQHEEGTAAPSRTGVPDDKEHVT
jgi:hypothetical protein